MPGKWLERSGGIWQPELHSICSMHPHDSYSYPPEHPSVCLPCWHLYSGVLLTHFLLHLLRRPSSEWGGRVPRVYMSVLKILCFRSLCRTKSCYQAADHGELLPILVSLGNRFPQPVVKIKWSCYALPVKETFKRNTKYTMGVFSFSPPGISIILYSPHEAPSHLLVRIT